MRGVVAVVLTFWLGLAAAGAAEGIAPASTPSERAIAAYLQLEQEGKAEARDLAELGVLLVVRGDVAEAERYLRAAVKKDKHDFDVVARLALFLHREGRFREAIRYYRNALHERSDPQVRFMQALAEERCGRRHSAIRNYAEAFHARPELASPEKNSLVLDSKLALEAQLASYHGGQAEVGITLSPLDSAAVQRMMAATPPAPAPVLTPAPVPAPTPAVPVPPKP